MKKEIQELKVQQVQVVQQDPQVHKVLQVPQQILQLQSQHQHQVRQVQVIYGMIVTMVIYMFTIMMEVHHSGLILAEQVQKEKKDRRVKLV